MCGIAGIVSRQADEQLPLRVNSMTAALQHRGPDGEGYWQNPAGQVRFGHRRLSIIDLTDAGAQPMHYLERYTITYNGEIYNYRELKEDLTRKGFQFRSYTDTEVVLAAYACWGAACLQQFDGMFAFAIWDEVEQTLFAARDRFGEKPFFYYHHHHQLLFGSELKALWAGGVPKRTNHPMLYNFLTLGYTVNPADQAETFFEGISKLPAAAYLTYHLPSGKLNVQSYWRLPSGAAQHENEKETLEKFSGLLVKSVRHRLRSDVAVGTSLSGGLDSSTIAALMKQQGDAAAIKTFSAVFPGYEKDESRFIRSVQQKLDIENYQVQPDAKGFIKDFETLCHHQDEPFLSASIYAQYSVFALARRQRVTVLLDGQGADETLAGYHKYYHWYWQELYRTDRKKFDWEMEQARKAGIQDPWGWPNRMAAWMPGTTQALQKARKHQEQKGWRGLHKDFVGQYGRSYYELPRPDRLGNVLHYNTFFNGLEELLRYADRNSMAHGREVRLPFLQHELVEFIFSLPPRYKIRDARTKWILRETMAERLPAEVVWRTEKVGFEPPQQQWVRQKEVQELIAEKKKALVKAGIADPAVLKITKPQDTLAALDTDWRMLVAGQLCT